jgi:hypothetical protein
MATSDQLLQYHMGPFGSFGIGSNLQSFTSTPSTDWQSGGPEPLRSRISHEFRYGPLDNVSPRLISNLVSSIRALNWSSGVSECLWNFSTDVASL